MYDVDGNGVIDIQEMTKIVQVSFIPAKCSKICWVPDFLFDNKLWVYKFFNELTISLLQPTKPSLNNFSNLLE